MIRYEVILRSPAHEDSLHAARYIAEQGHPDTAALWLDGLERAIASLSRMPRRCTRARERTRFPGIDLRQMIYKSHRVIFAVIGREVHVMRVRHVARQDLASLDPDEND